MKSIEQMKFELKNKLANTITQNINVGIHGNHINLNQVHCDINTILNEFFDEHKPKKTKTTYSTIISKGNAFTEDINSMARQGWKPHGNLVIRNSHELVQLMVKETEVQF